MNKQESWAMGICTFVLHLLIKMISDFLLAASAIRENYTKAKNW